MNLDETADHLERLSIDPAIQLLSSYIRSWKANAYDVNKPCDGIERIFGNTWISDKMLFENAYETWSKFRDENIKHIGGMTMSERLWSFSLFEKFDACQTEAERLALYVKLKDRP